MKGEDAPMQQPMPVLPIDPVPEYGIPVGSGLAEAHGPSTTLRALYYAQGVLFGRCSHGPVSGSVRTTAMYAGLCRMFDKRHNPSGVVQALSKALTRRSESCSSVNCASLGG